MVIQRFEDIIAWQKAQNYAVEYMQHLITSEIMALKIKSSGLLFLYRTILLKVLIVDRQPNLPGL